MTVNAFRMLFKGGLKVDKLLWRAMAVSADRFDEHYDLAVAYIEGGAAYYVKEFVNADRKAGFIHIDYKEAGYTRKLDKNCYLSFDRIFTVSDEVKGVFSEVYPELTDRIEVFHNLLDIEGIKHKAELPGGFDDDFDGLRIVTVGRLNLQKSFDVSIDAMKLIKDAGIRARWYVLGEGDQREFLESRIEMLGLKEDFILLGNRANPYPYVKQCDLYVHASKFEGKSIAIQEARILGKPIVVTDCSGNREQINDGMDGRICDFDSNAIAETVIEMLKDKDKATQMGIAAANRILEEEKNSADLQKLINLLA
jgi:glycosyltransferase involved in cell wall biosynthesis